MSDDELVEKVAKVMALQPWDELHPGSKARLLSDARAALAVAEPVIRERCARIALYYPTPVDAGPHEAHGRDMSAVGIASAIRTGATP